LLVGASGCLSEISTSYRNVIVETFERKILSYLWYKLQTQFAVMIDINIYVITKFCYQLVCQGSPEWLNDNTLTETIKEHITTVCLPLRNLLNSQVTLSTLSKSPEKFVPFLLHILSKLEEEHQS
ncbi:hypothetical protein EDC94DRAFT_503552, partial [Helicostylum pulchrum]